MSARDHAAEARALPDFDFDLRMHGYLWKSFTPWIDGVSALELGCFHGAFTSRILKEFPDTCVVEASAECIEAARGRTDTPLVEFIHSTFEDVEINRKFDAIFLLHTMEHLDDPVFVLRRCREWLAPGGRLFLAVPNAHAASRQIAVKMGIIPKPTDVTGAERAHGHRRTYSRNAFEAHILRAGLRLLSIGGCLFKPLANFQMDAALKHGIIDDKFLDGCYELGKDFPDLCSSIFAVCE